MDYFAKRLDAYRHPGGVLAGAKSVIAMAYPYDRATPSASSTGRGKVARYAWLGDDYHDVIHPKLKRLVKLVRETFPDASARGTVDTAPLMEREIAQLAGLGWRGKNTLLLNRTDGSYFFLACLLVDIELPSGAPHAADHCGTCTACLDACPTDAFVGPGVLDANRCISYLTIEHRGPIDVALRPGIGDWVFGCDVCQEVCPWNRKPARAADQVADSVADQAADSAAASAAASVADSVPGAASMPLAELFGLTEDGFRARFRKTPMWRTRRRGMLRNAAIVLGNQRSATAIGALELGLGDPEPVVRGASAWALGRIEGTRSVLAGRLEIETDPSVIDEIQNALG